MGTKVGRVDDLRDTKRTKRPEGMSLLRVVSINYGTFLHIFPKLIMADGSLGVRDRCILDIVKLHHIK